MTSLRPWFLNPYRTKPLFSQHSCISRGQFTALTLTLLSKPTSLACYALSLGYTSSSSTHMCISVELFMLRFVFNTPSCKSEAARHKAVKTPSLQPVPPWPENLWPCHRPWDRSWEQPAWALAETRHPLVWRTTLFCLLLDALETAGWCHWQRCLTPIPQHLPSHLELWLGVSSPHPPPVAPTPAYTSKNLLAKSKVVRFVRVWTLYQCHVSSLNRTAAGNSHRENPKLFVTVVLWFLLKPGVGVKSSLPLTLQPCGLCAWQLPAL